MFVELGQEQAKAGVRGRGGQRERALVVLHGSAGLAALSLDLATEVQRADLQAGAFAAAERDASELARKAGLKLPIHSTCLQAMVTEPVKPLIDHVLVSAAVHVYVSQTGRGEIVIGGGADAFNSYAQRGGLPVFEANAQAAVELFPCLSRLRVMRQWAGTADITPDTSPIMGTTPVEGLFISAGWGTGGYKAIPAGGETMAWTLANGQPHELIRDFTLERFARGSLLDEGAASGVAH